MYVKVFLNHFHEDEIDGVANGAAPPWQKISAELNKRYGITSYARRISKNVNNTSGSLGNRNIIPSIQKVIAKFKDLNTVELYDIWLNMPKFNAICECSQTMGYMSHTNFKTLK